MANDNSFDHSSNNIQKYFSDNIIGSVHMSQYRDPNDDASSNNSTDTLGLTQRPDDPNEDLAGDEDELNATIDHIKLLLDQSKRATVRIENNGNHTLEDPFETFLTANNNKLYTDKRILISQKKNPPIISKKFQAHPPLQDHMLPTLVTNNDNDINHKHNSLPNTKKGSENPDKIEVQNQTESLDVETVPNYNGKPQTTENDPKQTITDADTVMFINSHNPDKNNTTGRLASTPNNNNNTLFTTVTPTNKTPKTILNPYAKHQQLISDSMQHYHTPLARANSIASLTDCYHTTGNITDTPVLKTQMAFQDNINKDSINTETRTT